MKKIKMLTTRYGCEDGFNVNYFTAGKEYEVAESLACRFLRDGFAVVVDDIEGSARKTTENRVPLNPATQPERFNEITLSQAEIIQDCCNDFDAKYRSEFKRIFGHDLGAGI